MEKYRKAEYVQRRVGLSNVQDVLGKASKKGHLPSQVVFHQRLSSIGGCLPSEVVFRQAAPELPPSCPRATPEVNQGI